MAPVRARPQPLIGDTSGARTGSYSQAFDKLCAQFTDAPLPVSFRDLVGSVPADSGAHRVHPYPARLLRQLPRFFFGCDQLVSSGDVVCDPFCGSGTVLLEAMAHGYDSWGTDPNPFAVLLSKVKVTPVDKRSLEDARKWVIRSAAARPHVHLSPDPFLDRWFAPTSRAALGALQSAVMVQEMAAEHRDVMLVCLSLVADRVAHKDRRIPVPVRLKGMPPAVSPSEIRALFSKCFAAILQRLPNLADSAPSVRVIEAQAKSSAELVDAGRAPRPDLILTSPPYGAAQKYIRSSSISLAVLGISTAREFQQFTGLLAGREWIREADRSIDLPDDLVKVPGLFELLDKISTANGVRGAIYRQYFVDMWDSLVSGVAALSEGGHYVLVSSSNTVAGMEISTHEVLAAMLQELGLTRLLSLEDRIAGRTLMTRRATTASSPIQSEVVHLFRKSVE